MLIESMYVRCPADKESIVDPRVFICGQIVHIDDFKSTASVMIHDPFQYHKFFPDIPEGIIEVPLSSIDHCRFFIDSEVVVRGKTARVLSCNLSKTGLYVYYVQIKKDKTIVRVFEKDVIASFTNGEVDPTVQLLRYEFQNPCWFMGHAVVSRSVNILDNSIMGFKELAGSKIYLLPHQVNTIMRCLQENPCRYMLADEVGMGKTVEAISILKIYLHNNANKEALIIVPNTLKEQWKTELLLKFNTPVGPGKDNNCVTLKTIAEVSELDASKHWDFIIVDEVHKLLGRKEYYHRLHSISQNSENVLLLSATPVQQRKEEYLDLLRLLQPDKYDTYDLDRFSYLIERQSRIIQKAALILDDLGDLEDEMSSIAESDGDPHSSDDCIELYDEIHDDLEEICADLRDEKLTALLEKVCFNSADLGVYQIKVMVSYICSNYQVESKVIRNRRRLLESNDDGSRLLPVRKLMDVSYTLDKDKNTYEAICYKIISDWFTEKSNVLDVDAVIRPITGSFFSSSWAFQHQLFELSRAGIPISSELLAEAENWVNTEEFIVTNIRDILDDPDSYESEFNSRIVSVLNLLYDELYDKKLVLFTNYIETFMAYRRALEKAFSQDELSFFGAGMTSSDMELNAYRFQSDSACRIMLCDYSGGEGRNFQCADYVVHIDLPWDANMIEQRIGRLDRLERDPARPIVTSLVVHTEESFEHALFQFWNDGLGIFTQSLSGMEIIMEDINKEIVSAVRDDFKYGLFDRIPVIIRSAKNMREAIRKEQNYDAAGSMFRPLYVELKRLIEYYDNNENELFASTMTNWASLAGFNGHGRGTGIITYTASSFSPQSAINSQLIPPRWAEYLILEHNRFVNRVLEDYDRSLARRTQERSIKGTFTRKLAIENDYLHFFAPGDDVFDCIVNNAMLSCKGRSSAFAILAELNWTGLIFTWKLSPNITPLLDKGISSYALGPYRHYLLSEQVTTVIAIDNPDLESDERVEKEYKRIINDGFKNGRFVHLGKRKLEAKFLKNWVTGSNITWFRETYPEERWKEIVNSGYDAAKAAALEKFKRKSNIRGAREEMERALSARAANSVYYGTSDEKLESLKREQEILLDAIRRPRITLDSAAFVWMVKKDYGSIEA